MLNKSNKSKVPTDKIENFFLQKLTYVFNSVYVLVFASGTP